MGAALPAVQHPRGVPRVSNPDGPASAPGPSPPPLRSSFPSSPAGRGGPPNATSRLIQMGFGPGRRTEPCT